MAIRPNSTSLNPAALTIDDTPFNRRRARDWMRREQGSGKPYENSTVLAEACANEFDLYENTNTYDIPSWIFECSLEVCPGD